jgi:hypothetical protein
MDRKTWRHDVQVPEGDGGLRGVKPVNVVGAVVAILAIGLCVQYVVAREGLRGADLRQWYREDNARDFGGKLPGARAEWSDLTDKNYEGDTIGGGSDFLILLDRKSNTTESHTREILRHEECHIANWDEIEDHGPLWQKCFNKLMKAT